MHRSPPIGAATATARSHDESHRAVRPEPYRQPLSDRGGVEMGAKPRAEAHPGDRRRHNRAADTKLASRGEAAWIVPRPGDGAECAVPFPPSRLGNAAELPRTTRCRCAGAMDGFSIAIVMLTFLLAGGVKGVVGLGLPTVSVALLSAAFGSRPALPLLVIPSFVTNVWQGAIGGTHSPCSSASAQPSRSFPSPPGSGTTTSSPRRRRRWIGCSAQPWWSMRAWASGGPAVGTVASGAGPDSARRARQRADHRRQRDLRESHRDVSGSARSGP